MRIEIWKGDAARVQLDSWEFRDQWEQLYAACPWASVFQSHAHAAAWYGVYGGQFEPVLVAGLGDAGGLWGLLPLALTTAGDLVAVGGHQAEYQVWMSRAEHGDAFVESALERLSVEYPGRSLVLRYLPPNTPLEWLSQRQGVGRRCVLGAARRGIMDIDPDGVEATLRKKGNRRQLRGLERFAPVAYERLTDPAAIDKLLEEMVPLCDLRHGAMHNVLPFRSDPLKLAYHRALARIPGLLHVSVLRCGDQLASAQIDFVNRGQITLALGAFAPSLARYSPGRLHMFFVARDVAANGYRSIDLTPGGGYKEQLATRFDEAYTLELFPDSRRRVASRASSTARRVARSVLTRAGVDPNAVRERIAKLRVAVESTDEGNIAARTLTLFTQRGRSRREVDVYELGDDTSCPPSDERPMQVGALTDLLAYQPGVSGTEPRSAFLKRSLALLEHGSHVYTRAVGGQLVNAAWVSRSVSLPAGNAGAGEEFGTVIVHDFTTALTRDGAFGWNKLLPQLLHDARQLPDVTRVLVAVARDDADVATAARQLGATPVATVLKAVRGTPALPERPTEQPAGVIG